MKAPEKIYLQVCGDCNITECDNCKFEDLEENVTWCKDKIFDKDIEYIRTDVFIERACEFMETYPHMFMGVMRTEMIEDFKQYLKGQGYDVQ